MTPQEKKEEFITNLQAKIEAKFDDGSLTATFSTCDFSGWSKEEFMYMPEVARRLREKGYTVSSKVNWEVTDWSIAL